MSDTTLPSINLLSKKKLVFDKNAVLALRIKVWSGMVLAGYVIIVVITLITRVIMSQRLSSIQAGLDKAGLSLSSTRVTEQAFRQVVAKSVILKSLLSNRTESVQLWKQLQGMLPVGSELSSFSIEKNVLKAVVKTDHVLSANSVLDLVTTQFQNFGMKKLTTSVSRLADASYSIGFEMALK